MKAASGSFLGFSEAVERTAGAFLADHGFSRLDILPTRVTYQRDRVVVSFAYYAEDLPSPWVAIEVGLVGGENQHQLVGLWRALSDDEPARGYTTWRFSDAESLNTVLERVVAEVLAVHGPGLWESEEMLVGLLALQADEVESRYLADRRRADLLQARRAYDEGRFQAAIDSFVLLEPNSLAASDRRRLHEAHKRVGRTNAAPSP